MGHLFKGLERIEEARERLSGRSFMAGLFVGKPDFSLLLAPEEPPEQQELWERFRPRLETFLRTEVDPDEIERTAKIPDSVLQGLFALGAFGMKIPTQYGGLGLSYSNYGRALVLMASWSNILALTVAVPQSIGIAMPLLLFGNEEQKRKYLPVVAREAVSAFALTESITGSDAAHIQTEAVLDPSGTTFLVNGEKLWCTNGSIARYVTLIARVPARRERQREQTRWVACPDGQGAEELVHTAFVLDMRSPGVLVRQRCQFEGCRGIENAYMTFSNVKIPADDLIGEVGRGLKYALTILNVGRAVSIPAICLGMAKQAWQPTLDRANQRLTFQRPLSQRQTQRVRLGRMAANLWAMEALASTVWRMAEQHSYDVRIEAAVAKIFCSETTIRFLKDAQVIFGGMGYETADSKGRRGEPAFGIEQLVRDAEMYRIGEGATDILRPFVAREGLSPHLDRAQRYLGTEVGKTQRLWEWLKLVCFYVPWYLSLWRRQSLRGINGSCDPRLETILRQVERSSRRLARAIFWAMVRHGKGLRDDQGRQARIEAIGEELLTVAASAISAESFVRTEGDDRAWELVDQVFRQAQRRLAPMIHELGGSNEDQLVAEIGHQASEGHYPWLSNGIIARRLCDYISTASSASSQRRAAS
ncbi:MAG: acyl-CoA dehydrogenase family protein [Nitrospiraceae bacterium]|nr:acyl-CoA dehydrogenase family protein [Nitrospiraceae bacterium]